MKEKNGFQNLMRTQNSKSRSMWPPTSTWFFTKNFPWWSHSWK